jgi:hypothetical protein
VLDTVNGNQILRGVRFGPVAGAVPVTIVSNPQPQSVFLGETTAFTVSASSGPFTYQWYLNSNALTNGPSISGSGATITGAQAATLTVSSAGAADNQGSYSVVVNNPFPADTATSGSALLTVVVPPAPKFATTGAGPVTLNGNGAGQLNFSGTAGTTYHIWGTANVALTPLTSTWTLLGAGTFSGGADSFAINTTNQRQFYVITQP